MEAAFCLQTAMYNYDSSSTAYVAGCKAIGFLLEFSVWVMLLYMSVLVFHLACLTILIEIRSTILIGVTYCVLMILTLSEPAEQKQDIRQCSSSPAMTSSYQFFSIQPSFCYVDTIYS